MHPEEITLKWLGAAGFELRFSDKLVLVDPFLSRPADASPRLNVTRNDYKHFDLLLATHGHIDHFRDVPYLAVTVDAPVYLPRAAKKDLRDEWRRQHPSARKGNPDQWKGLEDSDKIKLGSLSVTPLRTYHEVFDVPTVAGALGRAFGGRSIFSSLKTVAQAVTTHPYGNTHALHFDWGGAGARMLFLGSLTRHIYGLDSETGRADVLAVPYCPANRQWLTETERLIRRIQPRSVMVHHFDRFYPPFTYNLNLQQWKQTIEAMFPSIRVYIPRVMEPFTLEDVQGERKS